jgi:uncharacterized phage infection (PIP) family protein YhgE
MANAATSARATSGKERGAEEQPQVPQPAGLYDHSKSADPWPSEAITQPGITVEEQAKTIKQLETKVNEQAETIKQLETEAKKQAETIKQLETTVKKQLGEMAAFTFPSPVRAKFDRLMDKNNEGMLTPGEYEELRALVDLNELVTLLKGQARLLPSLAPAAK